MYNPLTLYGDSMIKFVNNSSHIVRPAIQRKIINITIPWLLWVNQGINVLFRLATGVEGFMMGAEFLMVVVKTDA